MLGVQEIRGTGCPPNALHVEWTINTKLLEFAVPAIKTAAMCFACINYSSDALLGCALPFIGNSLSFERSLFERALFERVQLKSLDRAEKVNYEIAKREGLVSELGANMVFIGMMYLDSQTAGDHFFLGVLPALCAGAQFSSMLARHIIESSAVYVKQEEKLSDIPLVTGTVRIEDGAIADEVRL